MTLTQRDAVATFGVGIDDHHDLDDLIPIHTGPQRQGDVFVLPVPAETLGAKKAVAVPAEGIPVVRGEAGGNTHLLLASGAVMWAPRQARPSALVLGVLRVAAEATAFLAHPEHGFSGIGAGTYEVRRQREQADEIRLVAD